MASFCLVGHPQRDETAAGVGDLLDQRLSDLGCEVSDPEPAGRRYSGSATGGAGQWHLLAGNRRHSPVRECETHGQSRRRGFLPTPPGPYLAAWPKPCRREWLLWLALASRGTDPAQEGDGSCLAARMGRAGPSRCGKPTAVARCAGRGVRLREEGRLSAEDWEALVAGEPDPFGAEGLNLQWLPKKHFFVLRGEDGRPVATTGLVVADVEAGGEAFAVVGVGAVIVSEPQRGRGLMRRVLDAALETAPSLGPDRAMLFCSPANVARYARFGFREIESRVVAQQPAGPVEMPAAAMWRPLRPGATWPAGPVRLPGPPF